MPPRAISSAVERLPYKQDVAGSNPAPGIPGGLDPPVLACCRHGHFDGVAQGLNGKAGKKPASDPAAGGKRRGRPAKASNSADTGQIGLAL